MEPYCAGLTRVIQKTVHVLRKLTSEMGRLRCISGILKFRRGRRGTLHVSTCATLGFLGCERVRMDMPHSERVRKCQGVPEK